MADPSHWLVHFIGICLMIGIDFFYTFQGRFKEMKVLAANDLR
jgi:hypothetical protein